MTGYYNLTLGLILLAFVGVTGASVLGGIGLTTAVPLGALVSLGLVIHGMFINGPADTPAPPTSSGVNTDGPFGSARTNFSFRLLDFLADRSRCVPAS